MLEKRTVSQCGTADYCRGWNAAIDAMPKWISVEEKKPEAGERVLLCLECFVGEGWWTGKGWSRGGINVEDIFCGRVTHWMPFPEPPKEE